MKKIILKKLNIYFINHIYPYFKTINDHMDTLYNYLTKDTGTQFDSLRDENKKIIDKIDRLEELFYLTNNKPNLIINKREIENVLFLNDTFNDFHHGSSGTSYVIRKELQTICNKTSSLKLEEVRNSKFAPIEYNDFLSNDYYEKWKNENKEIWELLNNSDMVVFNGEGCISHYNKDTCQLLYICFLAKRYLKKGSIIINTSIYLTNYVDNLTKRELGEFEKILRLVLENCDYVAVREYQSYMEVNRISKLVPLTMSFDSLPLYVSKYYQKKKIIKEDYILISGGNYLPDDFENYIKDLIKVLPKEYKNLKIYFLFCKVKTASCQDDLEHYEKLSKLKLGIKLIEANDIDEFLSIIEDAKFLISGRFHHSIASFMLDTPFISFKTNTKKMESILSMLDKSNVLMKENYVNSTLKLLKNKEFFIKNNRELKEKIIALSKNNYKFIKGSDNYDNN